MMNRVSTVIIIVIATLIFAAYIGFRLANSM